MKKTLPVFLCFFVQTVSRSSMQKVLRSLRNFATVYWISFPSLLKEAQAIFTPSLPEEDSRAMLARYRDAVHRSAGWLK